MPMVPKYSICGGTAQLTDRGSPWLQGLCPGGLLRLPPTFPFPILLAFLSLFHASLLQGPVWSPRLLEVFPDCSPVPLFQGPLTPNNNLVLSALVLEDACSWRAVWNRKAPS